MDTLYIGGMSSVQIRIVFIRIFVVVFPLNITITSSGPAAKKYPEMMGDYRMIITTVRGKPVWKKTDGDYYIYYTSMRFILLAIVAIHCLQNFIRIKLFLLMLQEFSFEEEVFVPSIVQTLAIFRS